MLIELDSPAVVAQVGVSKAHVTKGRSLPPDITNPAKYLKGLLMEFDGMAVLSQNGVNSTKVVKGISRPAVIADSARDLTAAVAAAWPSWRVRRSWTPVGLFALLSRRIPPPD